jgi:hypothetical protein
MDISVYAIFSYFRYIKSPIQYVRENYSHRSLTTGNNSTVRNEAVTDRIITAIKKRNYFEMYQPVRVSSRILSSVFFVQRLTITIATIEMMKA